jgi:hypothetical protein
MRKTPPTVFCAPWCDAPSLHRAMCFDETQAVLGQDHGFCPQQKFSFFMWGETGRVSLHCARASCLWLTGWHVGVGRNSLSFAPGVGQYSPLVGRNSSVGRLGIWDCGLAQGDRHSPYGDGAPETPQVRLLTFSCFVKGAQNSPPYFWAP